MKVSIFYTVFYGIIVHFLITMIFTNSSLFSQFFYVILYSIYALLADVVSAMLPVVLFHENINRVLSGGWVRAVFTLVYLILLGVLIGLTIMIGKQNNLPADKGKADFYRNCVVVRGNRANRHDCCSKSITAIPGKRFFHACDNFCLCVIPVYDYAVIYL